MYNHYTIYRITNLINNKVYIGQTINKPLNRWSRYRYETKRNFYQYPIYLAIRKHGIENFIFELICSCFDLDELNKKETWFIDNYNSNDPKYGYNCDRGGNNKIFNKTTLQNMSRIHSGKNNGNYGNIGDKNPCFGTKRPEMSKMTTGENNPRYDHTIYHFVHEDGRQEFSTRYNFYKTFNLPKHAINRLIWKKIRTYKGWSIIDK